MKKMNWILLILLSLQLNYGCEAKQPQSLARAAGQEKPEHTPASPSPTHQWSLVYKGEHAFNGRDCYLLLEKSLAPTEVILARTNYSHFAFALEKHNSQSYRSEENDLGEFLWVNVDTIDEDIIELDSFRQRVWHVNHYHNELCENLRESNVFPDLDDIDHGH